MHTQPRAQLAAQLAAQLDDLQADMPTLLESGPRDAQCAHIVSRAVEILHRAGSMDRDYVTDRMVWILAKLPPTEHTGRRYDVDTLPMYDAVATRRRAGLGSRQLSIA